MRILSLEQTADFLETANVEHSNDVGHAIIHIGVSESGARFVLVNDCHGNTALTESA